MSFPDNVRFFVADTETTGAGPEDKVCELGWIEIDENMNVLSEVQSLIDPQYMISPSASGIHGLTNADVEQAPTIEEFFSVDDPSCYGRKVTDPIVLIGHRISFDYRFLSPYINVTQELCTLRWARKLYPHADDHKLSTLMFALGLPRPEGAHRVMSDIYSAFHLVKHICERTGTTIRQLAEASIAPMEVAMMPFGKHKGQPISDVPKSYIRWAMDNMKDLDADFVHTFQLALNKKKNNEQSTAGAGA
jgi:exodeoxyribonuclease X